MINEKSDRAAAVPHKFEARAHFAGKHGAAIFMATNVFGTAGVVHDQRNIETCGIFDFLKYFFEKLFFGIGRVNQFIELFDAAEGVLVS